MSRLESLVYIVIGIFVAIGFAIIVSQAIFLSVLIGTIIFSILWWFFKSPILGKVFLYFLIATVVSGIVGFGLGSTNFGIWSKEVTQTFLNSTFS